MNLPIWLDPTPLTRAFVGSFADAPVREPFIKQRKQLRLGAIPDGPNAYKLRRSAAGKAGAAVGSARCTADMLARGETYQERRNRQKLESKRRRMEQLKAAGDKGREIQSRRAAEEMAAMQEKPHERKHRQKLESQRRIRAARREGAGRSVVSAAGNSKRFLSL